MEFITLRFPRTSIPQLKNLSKNRLQLAFPSSMEAVAAQMEDMSYDSKAPLYPFGAGLRDGE